MEFCLVNGEAATFLLEEECYSGVAKIAEKVCGDVELVTGIRLNCPLCQGHFELV